MEYTCSHSHRFYYYRRNFHTGNVLGAPSNTPYCFLDILLLASKIAAARELFEETGLDIRNHLERLTQAPLRPTKEKELICELEQRIYFYLQLNMDDFKFLVRILIPFSTPYYQTIQIILYLIYVSQMNKDDLKPASYHQPMNVTKYPVPLVRLWNSFVS